MRDYTCEFLDITPFVERGAMPEKCMRREGTDVWQVRKEPIDLSNVRHDTQVMNWALQRSGDLVRIPLIPYRTGSMEPHELIMAVMDIAQRCVLDHHTTKRIHWVIGTPLEDLRQVEGVECFRVWLGLALQMH